MSEDIKKTISELHIYEKKLLKELEANSQANPEEIAQNTGMDIKAVMSAAGSLASKDIIEMEKDVEETYSLTEDGLNYANCFIGTVEGIPAVTALPEVKKALEAKGYTKVVLRPLMVVAGDHANNDMAADEEGSWYYAFVHGGEFEVEGHDEPVDIGDGFGAANVTCQINGLGEIAAIQQLYVAHVAEVLS